MIEFGRNMYRSIKERIKGEVKLPPVAYQQDLLAQCNDNLCGEQGRCQALTGARAYYKELYTRQKREGHLGLGAFMKMGRFTGHAYANKCPYMNEVNKVTGQEVIGDADEGDIIELS